MMPSATFATIPNSCRVKIPWRPISAMERRIQSGSNHADAINLFEEMMRESKTKDSSSS